MALRSEMDVASAFATLELEEGSAMGEELVGMVLAGKSCEIECKGGCGTGDEESGLGARRVSRVDEPFGGI